ncbi:MAG: hypothetical protein GKS05_07470 [Nitrospirales bacterium]|nr:hypothetical protein [Nitrospirales bacterium]
MNKVESQYYAWLATNKQIVVFYYQPCNIRLGSKLFYAPDFLMINTRPASCADEN